MVPTNESKTAPEELDSLLFAVANKDKGAFETLYGKVKNSIFTYALSIVKNRHDAEDLLHDSFLQIWDAASRYKSEGKPMAWILTITKNLCRMKLRERTKTAETPFEDFAILPDEGLSIEDRAVLRGCMERLSDEERQILLLHAVTGLRHREIAALVEKPLSTVLSKYNRAIKKIRTILEGGNT